MALVQIRRGFSAAWDASNPVLQAGEMGFALDTRVLKIGDGTAGWDTLDPISDPELLESVQALATQVEQKAAEIAGYPAPPTGPNDIGAAPLNHTHSMGAINGLGAALDAKVTGTGINAIVALTQAAYAATDPKAATTLYVITDA